MLRHLSRWQRQRQPGHTIWKWTRGSEIWVSSYTGYQHSRHDSWRRQQRRYLSSRQIDFDLDAFKVNSRQVIYQKEFSLEQQIQLHKALTGFTPCDSYSSIVQQQQSKILPGYHFVYCNDMVTPSHLLSDGTDDVHCPSSSGQFMFRLWAGGDLSFARPRHKSPASRSGPSALCLGEQVVDAKTVDGGDKVFVKIRRTLVEFAPCSSTDNHDNNNHRVKAIALDLDAAKKLNPTEADNDDTVRLHAVENRWLCFTRSRPTTTDDSSLPVCPSTSSKITFDWHIVPDAALLFRFSALTLNAHAIHLDREYTRRVYGLRDLVVHGPLTVCLMMQVLGRALRQYEIDLARGGQLVIDSFTYTNLAPLYVDETMKICVGEPRPTATAAAAAAAAETTGLHCQEVWPVWISKQVDGVWRVAVRANAKVVTR